MFALNKFSLTGFMVAEPERFSYIDGGGTVFERAAREAERASGQAKWKIREN